MAAFEWPWQYNFPPFFTLQRNAETREKQLEGWRDLVLAYCRHKGIAKLDVDEAGASPLFYNKNVRVGDYQGERRLAREDIVTVLDSLSTTGHVEWLGAKGSKAQCHIMWRSLAEWGDIIFEWVKSQGLQGTVCTVFELLEGETGEGQEFHGMDPGFFKKIIVAMKKKNQAEYMESDDGDTDGVKFLAV
eukprot:m.39467 g.39467  ORF g.39467 m.39467 type:complete len:189 (+) comp10309_c0_seq2:100-666(+)